MHCWFHGWNKSHNDTGWRRPPVIRDNTRRDGRQSEEPLRDDKPSATAAVATTTKQQQRGRTATHADVATAGERDSHLSATADANAHTTATAADAAPATSTTKIPLAECVRPSTRCVCMEVPWHLLSRGTSWGRTIDS